MSDLFNNISDALADTVEAAAAGIIRVEGRKRLAATGMAWREGLIVTANHVVRRSDEVKVALPDGDAVPATVVGRDKHTDLAVLRVTADLQPMSQAGESNPLRVGHLALALGRPGEQVQATLGIVSAIGSGRMDGVIQTDVVMYPGFSGGPLVDASGVVQGMNTSGFRRGASIAIATKTISQVVDTLVEHGRVRQGFLGVGLQPVRLPDELAQELDQETGLIIVSLESGAPAENGGLLLGDIIVGLGGESTPHLDALLMTLSADRVGQEVPIKVVRGGQVQDVPVTIGEKL